jgi:diacylglycerol kinase (ATP)
LPAVYVIANPAAGRGRISSRLPAIRAAFSSPAVRAIRETAAPGDEDVLAADAIAHGADIIVAVGGDGTCSRIAGTIIKSGSNCRLAVVPAGTGNDFAKTLGLTTHSPSAIAQLVLADRHVPMDVGIADGHHFLNSCGFGFDASVLEASNKVRFLTGDAVYIYSALRQLFSYPGVGVSSTALPDAMPTARTLMVTVSNGKSLGGAFRIAPNASVRDGKLDVCFFDDSGVLTRLRLFLGAMRGTHLRRSEVHSAQARQLSLTFESAPQMEIDGELRKAGGQTVEIECLPNALSVIAAPDAPA